MKTTYNKKYTLDKSKQDKGFILIDEYKRRGAIIRAMDDGKRIENPFTNFEEYLFKDGLLRVNNKLEDNNDIELHSITEEGLSRLQEILGLSFF